MIDLTTVANVTGAFPNTVALNETIPDAGDGTPLLKKWVDDPWGFFQAVLTLAGTTPSGANETSSVSQVLNGLISIICPVGSVIAWHGAVLPDTLNHRLLHLDGAGVLVSAYTALDAACWVGSSKNATADAYYRADDSGGSSRSDSGIYLILPDAEKRVLRGHESVITTFPKEDDLSYDPGSSPDGYLSCKWCVRY